MRDLKDIDSDIAVECAILGRDRRAGHDCLDAQATAARIDQLLDERIAATPKPRIPRRVTAPAGSP